MLSIRIEKKRMASADDFFQQLKPANDKLSDLAHALAAARPEAALIQERDQAVRSQLGKCCLPLPKPCCHYEPCKAPRKFSRLRWEGWSDPPGPSAPEKESL